MNSAQHIVRKAYVAVLRDGRVLMTQDVEGHPGWKFPGGHAEEGESIEDAAIREIQEEVGLDIQLGKEYFTQQFVPPGRDDETHMHTFFIAFSEYGDVVPRPAEVKEAKWFLPSEIRELMVEEIYVVQKEAIEAFLRAVSA